MLQLIGLQMQLSATKIMAFETVLATNHMKKEETRNTAKLYNKYNVADLKS
jgi:putative endopeptidase